MATRIYTKTGDSGETGLFGGARVGKDDLRVETYGTVDELNAAVGLARALGAPAPVDEVLAHVQRLLFELGAELATAPGKRARPTGVTEADVVSLEQAIDASEACLPALTSFILPGGTPCASALHLARNVCRRAERRCVALQRQEPQTPSTAVKLLNRLSDLLFVLARRANHELGAGDVAWISRTPPGA